MVHDRCRHADERRSAPALLRAARQAVDAAKAALAPVFDGGAYDLSEDELSLISEVSVKLGMLRMVVMDRDLIPTGSRRAGRKTGRAALVHVLRREERADDRPR